MYFEHKLKLERWQSEKGHSTYLLSKWKQRSIKSSAFHVTDVQWHHGLNPSFIINRKHWSAHCQTTSIPWYSADRDAFLHWFFRERHCMSRAVCKRTARPDALNARQASRTHIITLSSSLVIFQRFFFLSLCVYVCALVVNYLILIWKDWYTKD